MLKPKDVKTEQNLVPSDFPALGNVTSVSKVSMANGSFADKAESWRQQRLQDDHNKIVESRMAKYRHEKAEARKLDDELLAKTLPFRNSGKTETIKYSCQTKNVEQADDGWTTVEKKSRHVRKDKVDFEEVPEELSSSSEEEQEQYDKDSLWK